MFSKLYKSQFFFYSLFESLPVTSSSYCAYAFSFLFNRFFFPFESPPKIHVTLSRWNIPPALLTSSVSCPLKFFCKSINQKLDFLLFFVSFCILQDLSKLGRKLERIVIIDNSPASYIFHQDNAVSPRTN